MAKTPTDIRSLARSHTATAMRVLARIMRLEEAPHAARVAAAKELLDRGWGKPKQEIESTIRRIPASQLHDDELASIAAGGSIGAAETQDDTPLLN